MNTRETWSVRWASIFAPWKFRRKLAARGIRSTVVDGVLYVEGPSYVVERARYLWHAWRESPGFFPHARAAWRAWLRHRCLL